MLAGPGCGETEPRKPPPNECLEDSDCEDGLSCTFFRCVDRRAGTGGKPGGSGGDGPNGGGSGGEGPDGGDGGDGGSGGEGPDGGGSGGEGIATGHSDNVDLKAYRIRASALVADSLRDRFYAVVKGDAPEYANHLVTIDRFPKAVIDDVEVGSDPGALAMTSNRDGLWVGLSGAHSIRYVDLAGPSPVPGEEFPLPEDDAGNPTTAKAISTLTNGTVAVSLESEGHYYGIAVQDSSGRLSTIVGPSGPTSFAVSLENVDHIYGSSGDAPILYDLVIDGSGIELKELEGVLTSPAESLAEQGHFLAASSGDVIDLRGDGPVLYKTIPYRGLVVPDLSTQVVFMLTGSDRISTGSTLRTIKIETTNPVWTGTVPPWNPKTLHHLGRASLLAFACINDDVIQQIDILK